MLQLPWAYLHQERVFLCEQNIIVLKKIDIIFFRYQDRRAAIHASEKASYSRPLKPF